MGPFCVTLLLLVLPVLLQKASSEDSCAALIDEAHVIRQEGYSAIEKADVIRDQAYLLKNEAIELKEESLRIKESGNIDRSRIEIALIEAIMAVKSQSVATSLYIEDIRDTLGELSRKITKIEENTAADIASLKEQLDTAVSSLKQKIGTDTATLKQKIYTDTATLEQKIEIDTAALKEDLEFLKETADSQSEGIKAIKRRQQTWLSEVRLISLYKVAEQNLPRSDGRSAALITDGQFTFDQDFDRYMRTYSQSGSTIPDNKIWVELGGTFKITKIVIWNVRQVCCKARLAGVHIYADEKLIGAIITAEDTYTFDIEEDVFAQKVLLHQPRTQYIHILEMQVWGMGPFPENDVF